MRTWSIDGYLERLAAAHPTPAGSAVAALNLAQAAALLAMVTGLRPDPGGAGRRRAEELGERALRLADADSAAVTAVADAYALPRDTPDRRARRTAAIADALLAAAGPPVELIGTGAELLELCERLAGVGGVVGADVAAAADAAAAAISISRTNVELDIRARRDTPEADRLAAALDGVDALLRRAGQVREGVRRGRH